MVIPGVRRTLNKLKEVSHTNNNRAWKQKKEEEKQGKKIDAKKKTYLSPSQVTPQPAETLVVTTHKIIQVFLLLHNLAIPCQLNSHIYNLPIKVLFSPIFLILTLFVKNPAIKF